MDKEKNNPFENFFKKTKSKKIVNCVACGKPVSRLAKTCHHCNEPEPADETKSAEVTEGPFFERFVKNFFKIILFIIAFSILAPIASCYFNGY